jgi:hypothetical protein
MVFSSMPVILCQLTNAAPATVQGLYRHIPTPRLLIQAAHE